MSLSVEKARTHMLVATIIQLIQNLLFSVKRVGFEVENAHVNRDDYSVKI